MEGGATGLAVAPAPLRGEERARTEGAVPSTPSFPAEAVSGPEAGGPVEGDAVRGIRLPTPEAARPTPGEAGRPAPPREEMDVVVGDDAIRLDAALAVRLVVGAVRVRGAAPAARPRIPILHGEEAALQGVGAAGARVVPARPRLLVTAPDRATP